MEGLSLLESINNNPITKIPLTPDLDPDFGYVFPSDIDVYVVTVFSKKLNNKIKVVIIVPDHGKELICDVLKQFFSKYNKHIVTELRDDEINSYLLGEIRFPIISFDPDIIDNETLSFFWLYPPKELMH